MARVIGLTGGIASGKSTVAAMLREQGAAIVDADEVARAVVEPGTPGLQAIVDRFGDGVLDRDGCLDRKALGERVFGDVEARKALERILHPRIAMESQRRIAAHGDGLVIYDAALIVENGLHRGLAGLIVVSAPADVQRARLMARDGIDEQAAQQRIASQLPLADKVAVADWVVDNAGTRDDTRRQVEAIWAELTAASTEQ